MLSRVSLHSRRRRCTVFLTASCIMKHRCAIVGCAIVAVESIAPPRGGRFMFDEKVDLHNFDQQDPEYKQLLSRVLTIQSDCEIGGPHLYVEHILGNAPTKGYQFVVART